MKKIAVIICAVIISALCAIGLVACGGGKTRQVPNAELSYEGILENGVIVGYEVSACKLHKNNTVEIPKTYNGKPVISIGEGAFSSCSSLTNIEIPNSVTSIGDRAFSNCSSLTSVVIPNSVTSMGNAVFHNCSNIISATLPTVAIASIPKTSLKTVVINGGDSIRDRAFSNCISLTSVTIGHSVMYIGSQAFRDCSNLESATISNSLSSLGDRTFYGCSSLKSITIPIGVWSIDTETFYGCINLTSVTIGNNVEIIWRNAFFGCSSLTRIVIPDSVEYIGAFAFNDCSSLTIYCEATEKPSMWDDDWNSSDRPVVWGYKN